MPVSLVRFDFSFGNCPNLIGLVIITYLPSRTVANSNCACAVTAHIIVILHLNLLTLHVSGRLVVDLQSSPSPIYLSNSNCTESESNDLAGSVLTSAAKVRTTLRWRSS